MAFDNKGQPKGFAFVEFENEKEALAALAANNFELKKRRLAVTLADNRKTKRCVSSSFCHLLSPLIACVVLPLSRRKSEVDQSG